MTYWILIIMFSGTGGAAIHHVDFFDEKACIRAAEKVLDARPKDNLKGTIGVACVPAQL